MIDSITRAVLLCETLLTIGFRCEEELVKLLEQEMMLIIMPQKHK